MCLLQVHNQLIGQFLIKYKWEIGKLNIKVPILGIFLFSDLLNRLISLFKLVYANKENVLIP